MTLQDLIRLFRTYTDDPRGTRWSQDDAIDLLNAAQEEVQEVIDSADEQYFSNCIEYSVASSSDAWEFELPADFLKVISLERVVTGGKNVQGIPIDFRKRLDYLPDPLFETQTGLKEAPRYYLRGTRIGIVRPRSSYTARLFYTKKIADFSNDSLTAVSEIPRNYHRIIPLAAARQAYNSEESPFPHADMLDEWVGKLQSFIERRGKQEPRYVHVESDDLYYL